MLKEKDIAHENGDFLGAVGQARFSCYAQRFNPLHL